MSELKKEKKKSAEIVPVFFEDRIVDGKKYIGAKTTLQTNFPELELSEKAYQKDMYELKKSNKQGCYLSIKIPSDWNEAGKAIHVNTMYYDSTAKPPYNKPFQVYPKEHLGRGLFKSRSINRNRNWRTNLMNEARIGMDFCHVLHEPESYMKNEQRDELYTLFYQKSELIHEKTNTDCQKYSSDEGKNRCHQLRHEIDEQIDIIDIKIKEKLRKK